MKRVCEYCGIEFDGLAKLFNHKREHPEWTAKMKATIDLWEVAEGKKPLAAKSRVKPEC